VLQTSQVLFRRICVSLAMVLPFKDSSEAAEPRRATFSVIKLPNNPRWSAARPRLELFKMRVFGKAKRDASFNFEGKAGRFAYLTAHRRTDSLNPQWPPFY
jgi:hypothetical protein